MYIKREELENLQEIISTMNEIYSDEKKLNFLREHIEDTELFISVMKKISKTKFPAKKKDTKIEKLNNNAYTEEEIYELINSMTSEEFLKKYSTKDLKEMYISIYQRKPTLQKTKADYLSTFKNRMHTMKRAEGFKELFEEREKKKKK